MRMRIIFLAAMCVLLSPVTPAAEKTTADAIRTAAHSFLATWADSLSNRGYEGTYEIGHIDSRLALASCHQPLAAEFSGDPLRTTSPSVLISCRGERPWRMYVTTSVRVIGPALVAARPLARGERLTKDLLSVKQVQLNASRRGVLTDEASVDGMMMRRPVNSGTILTPDLLEAPNAIERGDHVMITARSGSFSVTSRGKALANAGVGEQVLVENLRSSRTVKARAVGPGRVEIPM
ncbi:flagellar basal body P-ring formation protein FlgA [Marinobacter daepoensis]|uniref:Flagella basal body P-ring formation protein FlgA n=1 Tax=Marinobacter daepoensis TaxID=262077 RepID=A0ABS3BC65_9GAMM|nr:flagellar basal body P-ring formation protein FlgA [Marinobacter daepoensis]MBY6077886.1 flagellar basal body P-ring formation protein FlgA [Marinobacter daepoensis]